MYSGKGCAGVEGFVGIAVLRGLGVEQSPGGCCFPLHSHSVIQAVCLLQQQQQQQTSLFSASALAVGVTAKLFHEPPSLPPVFCLSVCMYVSYVVYDSTSTTTLWRERTHSLTSFPSPEWLCVYQEGRRRAHS